VELSNVAADHPEVVESMKEALLDEWEQRSEEAFPSSVRELSSDEIDALRALGYVAGGSGGDLAELELAFESDADPHAHLATVDRINMGLTLLRYGEPAQAAETLAEVVAEDPSNRFALEHLGRAYRDSGRLEDARDTYYQALALGRNPELVYLDLTEIENALGNRAAVDQLLTQALAVNPRSVEARTALAQVLIHDEQFDAALALLQEALRLRPRAAKTHLIIAQVYEELDRNEEAATHWRRLLELDPDGRFGRIARSKLGS
jgi:tetratricopeptide (TPR) repeat protein